MLAIPLFVVSTVFAIYTWIQSEVEIDPTMIVDPQRTVLIERERVKDAPVRVVRRDGTSIERDVTGVRLYFWNDGRKPMLSSEILEPFRLVVQEPAEILDFRVLKSSRQRITQVAVRRVDKTNNQLALDYHVLERGEGLALQLVIAGDSEATIRMEGAALGAPGVTTAESAAPKHPWHWFMTGGSKWVMSVVFVFFMGFNLRNLLKQRENSAERVRLRDLLEVSSSFIKGIIVGGVLALMFSSSEPARHDVRQWFLDLVPDALLDKPRSGRH